ncbi:MAG: MFS transporter [Alphaproteobacteria bacterium]|nr:MFS transporter [Alphaproteobacteria bacterium]
MPWWPSGGLWRHPDFLKLWAAQSLSAMGSRVTRTALPMIAILTIQASPSEIAILSALGVLPGVIVGLVAGGPVDRHAKRPLLIAADLVRAALILTIPLAAWSGDLSMPQLYAIAAAVGAASALFRIADNTYLPALVGKPHLVEGNAKLEATDSIAESVGPGLAGILIQVMSAPLAVIVDAASYLWSALMLSRIRAVEAPAAAPGAASRVLADIGIGFRACLGEPVVARLLAAETLMMLFGGFFHTLYMILALETLGLLPLVIGLVISVGGIGSFCGALVAERMAGRLGLGPTLISALAIGNAAALLIPLSELAGPFAVPSLVAHQLIGDAFLSIFLIHAISLRQRVLPLEVLGRANATFQVATGLALPLGALIAGPLAGFIGMSATMWVGAAGGLTAALALLSPKVLRAS